MYKAFLVEDEIVIREGLRSGILWEQYGFTLVGDAADGEMALPMIRQLRPDVLITDIRMPFMDGLALSRMVRRELPDTHIVIISGYDDFEYARQAIQIGVEQYLLKPITKAMLHKLLSSLREKLDQESQRRGLDERSQQDLLRYEQYSRRCFFEDLVAGRMTVQEIYEQAGALDIDMNAAGYNIVLFTLQSKGGEGLSSYSDALAGLEEELVQFLFRCPEYLLFRWTLRSYAVLIKGSPDQLPRQTENCIENISRRCAAAPEELDWYLSAGEPVQRLSQLPQCFAAAHRILSYRHLCPGRHLLTEGCVAAPQPVSSREEQSLKQVNMAKLDPEIVQKFLRTGAPEEVEDFVSDFLTSIGEPALNSMLFCQYIMLNVRFAATALVESLGCSPEQLLEGLESSGILGQAVGRRPVERYLNALLSRAITLRDQASSNRCRDLISQALSYIDAHYAEDSISLNTVAKAVNLSASYFSAVFSQEQGQTFTEYLTQKRMEQAKRLLRQTDRRSSEIAFSVGYKDPHYFSYLFKKTQGCTPRDYRGGGAKRR